MRAISALISGGHDSFRGRDVVKLTPGIARLDPVDTPSPRVVRDMPWRRRFSCLPERQKIRCSAMAEPPEIGRGLGEGLRGQSAAEVRTEKRVVVVLIAERWRI